MESADEQGVIDVSAIHPTLGEVISSVKSTCSAEVHGRNHFLASADEQGVIDVSAIHPTVGEVISSVKSTCSAEDHGKITSWKVYRIGTNTLLKYI